MSFTIGMALYRLCSGTYSVGLVSLVTSSPGFLTTLKILVKSGHLRQVLEWVILAGMAPSQAIAVTSIFVPGSLTIVSSPAQSALLEIQTIDLNTITPTSSSVYEGQALLSGSAPTWDTPAGCGISCKYSFSYAAPALNCTALSREDIWPNNNASSNSSLLKFPFLVEEPGLIFNSSNVTTPFTTLQVPEPEFTYYLSSSGPPYDPTFDLYYIEECHIYEATTSFSQNGQISTTHVIEWSDSFNPNKDVGDSRETFLGSNVTNITMALLSISSVYAQVLNGNLTYFLKSGNELSPIQAFDTPLFNLTSFAAITSEPGQLKDSPGILLSLSSDVSNLADGLQSLLGNSTLALVGEGTATTWVNATVVPDSFQYQYHPEKLGLIYGIVFGVALLVVVDGLICLWSNGTAANFDFQGIVEMTANSHGLHKSAVLPQFADVPVKGTLGTSSGSTARPSLNSDGALKLKRQTPTTDLDN
ncbi:hypothetical protein BDP27DRAFT_1435172 [Rhodocollybia butyracea]|uniref:Uncharacterized protein n=1 Tax=Rhodocollybia butyracea TaxID=206335 RepID=A0A9P5P7H9_9AGAR|nr:hypothetical protein BDP27DRAFT_1435172 [Rhodocollybia butyracea]